MSFFKKRRGEGKKGEAKATVETMLQDQTGDPAFMHRANWVTAYEKKDFEKALAECNRALEIVPKNALYLALRAMTQHALHHYADAHSDMKAALESNPKQKEALGIKEALKADAMQCRDKARALGAKDDHRGAMTLLNNAAALEPDNAMTYFFRGLTYAKLEDLKTAIADVRHAVQLDPQLPDGQKVLQALESIAASGA